MTNGLKSLETMHLEWERFASSYNLENAPQELVQLIERAFYAGAMIVYNLHAKLPGESDMTANMRVASRMVRLGHELTTFADGVVADGRRRGHVQ